MKYSGSIPFNMAGYAIENYKVHSLTTVQMEVLGDTLGAGDNGRHIWNVDEDAPYYWDGAQWVTGLGYTNLMAIGAVSGVLQNTQTINWDITGGTIKANARLQMSIDKNADGIKLKNDAADPGATKYYGTDGAGVKGWHSFPENEGNVYDFQKSIENTSGTVALKGDLADPGLVKYYGTNGDGTRGFFPLPNGGVSFLFSQSVALSGNSVSLKNDNPTPGNLKYYGTNGAGTKGWFSLPSGSALTFEQSISHLSGTVKLVNDLAAPGASRYYGTNSSGLKGWHPLPGSDLSVLEVNYTVGSEEGPEAEALTMILTDDDDNPITGKKVWCFRQNDWLHENVHWSYDKDTGEVGFVNELKDGEPLTFICWPEAMWTVINHGVISITNNGFPYPLPMIF